MDKSTYHTIKISIPTVEYTEDEWDAICDLLKLEFGYRTRAECRKHIQNDVKCYAEHLGEKWTDHLEEFRSL